MLILSQVVAARLEIASASKMKEQLSRRVRLRRLVEDRSEQTRRKIAFYLHLSTSLESPSRMPVIRIADISGSIGSVFRTPRSVAMLQLLLSRFGFH
ncbi:hypothetical protein PoB_007100600 [Plakobranchus ocellatus]|uniref:Uncharacterized protein n=1 Tax=Plakobranchus ocellatus TaxID=259542 RepID=A0AAV4DKK4_9GAST|nr:hypothetical protein PoB_007100600 [Plakobranchus ocellatus]